MSTRFERLIYIDQQIRYGNYPSARSVAEKFEVSERTAFDDRNFLRDRLHAPLEHNDDRGGWYYTDPVYVLPAIWVAPDELLSFFLGHIISKRYLGSRFEKDVSSGWEKIITYLPDNIRSYLEEAAQYYTIDTGYTSSVAPQMLQILETAIRERRQMRMVYYTASRDDKKERVIHPYHLFGVTGAWYLIAFDQWRQNIRTFHLERIESYHLLPDHFEPDSIFSATDYLTQGFMGSVGEPYTVVIRFDAQQAPYIREQQWHPTQVIEDLADGGLILRFHAGGLDAVQRWVMQYSAHAQVLEPIELRQAIAIEITKMAQIYCD